MAVLALSASSFATTVEKAVNKIDVNTTSRLIGAAGAADKAEERHGNGVRELEPLWLAFTLEFDVP